VRRIIAATAFGLLTAGVLAGPTVGTALAAGPDVTHDMTALAVAHDMGAPAAAPDVYHDFAVPTDAPDVFHDF
jgi:hypothetical protein